MEIPKKTTMVEESTSGRLREYWTPEGFVVMAFSDEEAKEKIKLLKKVKNANN